jgi:hypothetical protein
MNNTTVTSSDRLKHVLGRNISSSLHTTPRCKSDSGDNHNNYLNYNNNNNGGDETGA